MAEGFDLREDNVEDPFSFAGESGVAGTRRGLRVVWGLGECQG